MTDVVDGIPLFRSVSPEQLGSINLVLACLSDGPRDEEPTLRALLMRSGVSGGLVNPRDCLRFTIELRLVDETGDEVRLSTFGQELLTAASWPPYNLLTEEQGRRLLYELIQRPGFGTPLSGLLRKMTQATGRLVGHSPSVGLASLRGNSVPTRVAVHACGPLFLWGARL